MALDTPSRNPSLSSSPSLSLSIFQRVTAPLVERVVLSTSALDAIIKLCAGRDAMTRIERARNTRTIEKLSKAPTSEHVEDIGCDSTASSIKQADPSLIIATEELKPSIVHKYIPETPPRSPSFISPSSSASLYGLLFDGSSASRPSSPQKGSPGSKSDISFEGIVGRTNLANRFASYKPEPEVLSMAPSRQRGFLPDPKISYIAAQLAYERQAPVPVPVPVSEADGGEWVDEAEILKVKEKVTRAKQNRAGRRPVKFFGTRASKLRERTSREAEEFAKMATVVAAKNDTEDGCAIESCDDEDCHLEMVTQQKQRKRYQD